MTTGSRLLSAYLLIATLLYPQSKKSKKPKPPDAAVEKIEVRRDGDVVLLDGTMKNTGLKPIQGMVLRFEFYAPNRESLTIQYGPVEAAVIAVDGEAEFHLQVKYPSRAVELIVRARDRMDKDLVIDKEGPYRIE